jgi:hypothetical protein
MRRATLKDHGFVRGDLDVKVWVVHPGPKVDAGLEVSRPHVAQHEHVDVDEHGVKLVSRYVAQVLVMNMRCVDQQGPLLQVVMETSQAGVLDDVSGG